MAFKFRSSKRHRANAFEGENQINTVDTYFPNTQSPVTNLKMTGRNSKVLNANTSGFSVSAAGTAAANTAGSNYPRTLFRRRAGSKTIVAEGIGYGAGVIFWATDNANWWGAVTDVENSQTYDTAYGSSCTAYVCSAYYITGYWSQGYQSYNYSRMTYSYRYSRYYACLTNSCSAYYSYSNTSNYRYNGSLKVLRSIANAVSVVASAQWNFTQLDRVQVEVNDSAGTATIRAYNSGTERINTSVSGGSGLVTGLIGFNTTNGGYQGNIRLTRFTVS